MFSQDNKVDRGKNVEILDRFQFFGSPTTNVESRVTVYQMIVTEWLRVRRNSSRDVLSVLDELKIEYT